MLNSFVDVHLSGPLLDKWDSIEKMMSIQSNGTKKQNKYIRNIWEQFARGPYEHAREVLTRNWKDVNHPFLRGSRGADGKVFSSLQLALYPAISRYADVLMTTETYQVRTLNFS